jgi:ribosome-associated translation inhibitor RaiA
MRRNVLGGLVGSFFGSRERMHISITGSEGLTTDQVRAYAEYRVFAALARFGRSIREASVTLVLLAGDRGVSCTIDVDLGDGDVVHCSSTDPHVIGAIDRAAERARRMLERRARQEVPS